MPSVRDDVIRSHQQPNHVELVERVRALTAWQKPNGSCQLAAAEFQMRHAFLFFSYVFFVFQGFVFSCFTPTPEICYFLWLIQVT